jgi:hypothetical protein
MRRSFGLLGAAFLYIGAIPLLALVAAFLTGFIVVGEDHSELATIGILSLHGFPVWFVATAPGISIMSSWHPDRYAMNVAIWVAALLAIAIVVHVKIRKRRASNALDPRPAKPMNAGEGLRP